MCGIVGYYSSNDKSINVREKKAAMAELVIANSFRGMDSTGFFAVDADASVSMYKNIGAGWEFLEMKRARQIIQNLDDYSAVVFHNRLATVGGIQTKNAHPFDFEKIVGVHNGTLYSYSSLCKGQYPVDSQFLFAGIEERGAIETFKKAEGAIATIFYDKARKKLCVYRNHDRPLAYAKLKDDATFYYASEIGMLKWILERNKLDVEKIEEVPECNLFEIDIDDHTKITQIPVKYERPVIFLPTSRSTDVRRRWDEEEEAWANVPFSTRDKKAGFVSILDAGSPKKDSAGYSVGSKVLVEIVEAMSSSGGKYCAEGALVGYDYCKVVINGITPDDYKIMTPFIAKNNGLLLYANVMGVYNPDNYKLKWISASPFKPISTYATKKNQDQMMGDFVSKKPIVVPSPEEVLDLIENIDDVPALLKSDEQKNSMHGTVMKGAGGNLITLAEFAEATKHGCAICCEKLFRNDDIDWETFPEPCHSDCRKKWEIEQINTRNDRLSKKMH